MGSHLQDQLIIAVYKFTLNQNDKNEYNLIAASVLCDAPNRFGAGGWFPTVGDIFKPGGKYEYSNYPQNHKILTWLELVLKEAI